MMRTTVLRAALVHQSRTSAVGAPSRRFSRWGGGAGAVAGTSVAERSRPLPRGGPAFARGGARAFVGSRLAMAAPGVTPEQVFDAFRGKAHIGADVAGAMHALAMADCVCFDVDSTVIQEEGIDVLADHLGQGTAVAALTKQAMEGGMKFQDALQLRLELLRPSREQIQDCLRARPLELTPGVAELVRALQEADKTVYLVSGGFRLMIEPVAEILDIPPTHIVANSILFDETGAYRDFDRDEPTSRDMGKQKALQGIFAANPGFRTAVMVGDGATDAQAKPPARAFVGFGGVVTREPVKAVADWFVTDFDDLVRVVKEFGNRR